MSALPIATLRFGQKTGPEFWGGVQNCGKAQGLVGGVYNCRGSLEKFHVFRIRRHSLARSVKGMP